MLPYFIRSVAVVFIVLFTSCCIYATMLIGMPLYYVNRALYRAWMDLQERNFGVLLIFLAQWFTSSKMTVCTDDSGLAKGLRTDSYGRLHLNFASRAIIIANHQLYNDWCHLWWLAYSADLHGALVFCLKKSLSQVPIFGWGMRHLGFIFLDRDWKTDEKIISEQVQELTYNESWPLWLGMFPEGTVFNEHTHDRTVAYAKKNGLPVPKHVLLPRARGLQKTLSSLYTSINVLYDFTIWFSDIPEDSSGEQEFSLQKIYLAGKSPREIRIHIRAFTINEIPFGEDPKVFEQWLIDRWMEKDALMEKLAQNELPKNNIVARQQVKSWTELYGPFNVVLSLGLIARLWSKVRSTGF